MGKELEVNYNGGVEASRKCPSCHSNRIWKDGIRKTKNCFVQRYTCRDCGHRFSESTVLSASLNNSGKRQVCEFLTEGSKNLAKEEPLKSGLAGATVNADVKGKIVEFLWKMKKEGYSKGTIGAYSSALKRLYENGADLSNPETVKGVMAKQKWSEAHKHVVAAAYNLFLEIAYGLTWKPPICHVNRKLPFIPTERELDDLIAGCGKKTSTFLQLLKETAMRVGEASRLEWTDVDLQRKTVTLNNPEKSGNPRIFIISKKLVNMLSALSRTSEYAFGTNSKITRGSVFYRKRKSIAHKLANPRLLRIGFHTFRHWKATMLYHETQNTMLVKEFLGHKTLDTTLLYIQLEKALFRSDSDEFVVKAVKDSEEIQTLLEVGFEYVCKNDELMYFRKRK